VAHHKAVARDSSITANTNPQHYTNCSKHHKALANRVAKYIPSMLHNSSRQS